MASMTSPSSTTSSKRERLRAIIAEHSFSQGKDVVLASGKSSTFYFDMKQTMLHPEGLDLIGDLVLEKTKGLPAAHIGGLVMGAVPVALAAVMKSNGTERPLRAFWVRKEAKDHGTQKRADGYLPDGADVIVVEDVTTSGGSALQAIDEVRRRGCRVNAVITIVDRQEGARERLATEGIDLQALFTTGDFAG